MIVIYALYVILVHDYLTEDMTLHRIDFPDKEGCMFVAELLDQKKDPIVKKPNCTKIEIYEEEK